MSDPLLRDYVIRFGVPFVSLFGPRTGPLDYVSPVMGAIEHGRTEGELQRVGKFSFQHIRIAWAKVDGIPLTDIFATDPEWQALYPALFDANSGRLTTPSEAGGAGDILYIDEVSIVPEHRGRRLGGSIVDRIASLGFGQWAALVVRAAPERVEDGEWSDRVHTKPFSATGEPARKKLRVYWASFGFRPLGAKSEFMVRDATTLETAPASLRAL